MQFLSTRGQAPKTSFSDVLLAGLAPDGGLYLPQSWPQFSASEIAAFKGRRYQDVAFAILSRFTAGSFSDAELRVAIEAAYTDFDASDIAPLVEIGEGQFLLELLASGNYTDCLEWAGDEGEFRLINPERVAELWGHRKNKTNMNYEKMSRALR